MDDRTLKLAQEQRFLGYEVLTMVIPVFLFRIGKTWTLLITGAKIQLIS